MKKRLCAALLAVCLAVALLPVIATAVTVASGDCGAQGNNLTWTLDDEGTLTISGTGDMQDYAYNQSPWFASNSEKIIKSVVLADGVTSIGCSAFGYCSYLTSVTIPSSVISIGEDAFWDCGLTSITIPESVTSIGAGAFSGCQSLTSIMIPDSVTSIGNAAFSSCLSLPSIDVTNQNQNYSTVDGVLFNKNKTEIVAYPAGKSGNTYTISDGVTSIGDGAFLGCDRLTSITIPNSVTSIGNQAFQSCGSLASVTIPDSVTSIGQNAFDNCVCLTSITIPDSVTSIGRDTFYHCDSLTSITIPDSVTRIEGAFPFCGGLTSITIPGSVTSIGRGTFYHCDSLTSITIPNSVTRIGDAAFNGCSSLTDVYYSGTESQWSQITIADDNDPLYSATIHYKETKKLEDGVKYVPYNSRVEDYKITPDASIYYELDGTLPSGLSLDPSTSMISGVPMADGTWNFTVIRTLPDGVEDIPCTLTILSNTDAAVKRPNDYKIIIPVGTPDQNDSNHFYKDGYTEETLKIDGPYDEFYRLLIDGRELTQPDDYTAEEGSTVITIHAETFQRFGEGTHTIAAEFRPANAKNDPSQTKRVAQNYTLQLPHSSSGGSGNGSGGRSRPSINPNAQKPQQPQDQQQTTPFSDVMSTEWYYEDVVWAYQEGLMQGIDGTHFGPDEKVSQATIVTVLARLAQIDLSQFEGETEPDVPAGQYYTAAAIWAKRAGLMPSGGTFTGSEVTTRDQMAVMLTRYLTSMGKDTTPPAQPVTFEDAAGMSQEGGNAFQVLYQYGIFRGTGGMKMEPNGSTTRAQFVALMHRIYDTAVS